MRRLRPFVIVLLVTLTVPAFAASDRQPAPAGAPVNAPPQYTAFTSQDLIRGFMALAFGADLRVGMKPKGIRRFDRAVTVFIDSTGSVDRRTAMRSIVEEYGRSIPHLAVSLIANEDDADIIVHLIDEKDFESALVRAFGVKTARAFVARTDPQCMTSVRSRSDGVIVTSTSFIIADKGDRVFLDCAYHELLHAFGLSNHDQHNPWTMLNQHRSVGYLDVYDRALLTLLYDPRLAPGMSRGAVRKRLPGLIASLGLARGP
ncbi:MAG: hypothetical protein OJF62_001644 [Pseudolabrys sp.]|jgi:hypothetical protein|nr:hypothetical protein [Pseudolabrys sp.]